MSEGVPAPVVTAACLARRHGELAPDSRLIPEETPVAFTFGGSTHAVMMATPADLEDFAAGFALTEGLIEADAGPLEVAIVASELGVELRAWLPGEGQRQYAARRRSMAGPTGCGLCGVESLEQATRAPPQVGGAFRVEAAELIRAMEHMPDRQTLNRQTRAVHGAAFWRPADDLLILREDVGRHNALDKLAGALLRTRISGEDGVVLMTSRVSVELIQKAARIGAPVIAAISAPTALAVRTAEACGMTLVAVMRGRDFEVFTRPERIVEPAPAHVA